MDFRNKKILSWTLYDWANSAFFTTVVAGFFPVFFKQYWSAGQDATVTTAKLGVTLSMASLLIAILSPTLGVLADLRGSKKVFCAFFMVLGVASCFWLAVIPAGGWQQALMAYALGTIAVAASTVFYDALLPSIARGTKMDDVSSQGYAMGYLGGGILFLFNVVMVLKPEFFGLADKTQAVKVSFAGVGVWWLLFSLPLWRNVPEPPSEVKKIGFAKAAAHSIPSLEKTFRDICMDRNLFLSLVAFWLYIDGVYTVIAMAVDYGLAIGLESDHLMIALLLVQFIGFPSTWVFGKITGRFGCRLPILVCLGVYGVVVIAATWMTTALHFYLLAVVIGLVQGGVQSLSRSLFGNMIPEERAGEFFGFYNLIGKFASIAGPLVVALTVTITKNSRSGMTGLLILFVLGGYLLWKVEEPRRPAGARLADGQ
ncbi:MAG TPA: MFS transporter [Pseudobdellovibrionaceae bacterium]|nr:MFS transporter [Pseudobdellovibrionaceae bacterium]